MQSHPAPVRRTPPVPAIAAAVLGLLSTFVPAIFALAALAFSGGQFDVSGWLVLAVPVVLVFGLIVGAVLLLTGTSWWVLAVSAGLLSAGLVYGQAAGGWGSGPFGLLTLAIPLIATVLAVLPGVRSWIAARRAERAGG